MSVCRKAGKLESWNSCTIPSSRALFSRDFLEVILKLFANTVSILEDISFYGSHGMRKDVFFFVLIMLANVAGEDLAGVNINSAKTIEELIIMHQTISKKVVSDLKKIVDDHNLIMGYWKGNEVDQL